MLPTAGPAKSYDDELIKAVSKHSWLFEQLLLSLFFVNSFSCNLLHFETFFCLLQCLYEAVTMLDLLCSMRQRLIHGVFPTMKSLFVRVSQEDGYAHVLLALVKFFINHG